MAEKRCVEAKLTVDRALEMELDEVGEEFEQTSRAVAEVDTTSLWTSRTSTRREDTSWTHFQTTNMEKSVAEASSARNDMPFFFRKSGNKRRQQVM